MFYRAFAVGIVAFWLGMMALLVSVEFFSGESGLLPVPTEYVWKLIFLHEQLSDLVLYNQNQRIGDFHLQPRHLATGSDGSGGPTRLLTGSANMTLNVPALGPQSISLRGSMELDAGNTVRTFGLNTNFHEVGQHTTGLNLVLDGQPALDRWHYQLRRGEATLQENSGTSAILLDALDLRSFGIDPKAIMQAGQQQAAHATITARRGVLRIRGEEIESYVVTARQGEFLEITMYVSQLGQILALKTSTGYDLYDETLNP